MPPDGQLSPFGGFARSGQGGVNALCMEHNTQESETVEMASSNKPVGPGFALSALLVLASLAAAPTRAADLGPYEWALVRLDYARREKVEQLQRFCNRIHALADRAREDEVLVKFFEVNLKCFRLAQEGPPPDQVVRKTAAFRKVFNEYYIENWLAFYDILFIDKQGDIFYTIRRDSNFEKNLFVGDLSDTPLADCLRKAPQEETFIDFHYCNVSGEPAAFLVEAVHKDGKHLGWIVLQCAVNKINSLFAGTEKLGETGETFLVNHEGYMLTESNFEGDSTILKTRLSSDNIQAKFRERRGHRRVTDYRGFTALTSFTVVEFLGTQWLVVAKVDEAQITTEHFMQHRSYYGERIVQHLAGLPVGGSEASVETNARRIVRVDMDEFVKADHGEVLKTLGVSTCTAVIATYPGKFGYLAHVSPLDKIYGTDGTNLLGHITKKIKTYDVYKYERRHVRFVIIATHFNSLANAIDKLVDEGFLLSQISVLQHSRAKCANVTYDYSDDQISVEWVLEQASRNGCIYHGDDAHNLETVVKDSMGG